MTTVQEFALGAARKYLQSIVFVDDLIYSRVPATGVKLAADVAPAASMTIFRKPEEPVVEEVVKVKPEEAKAMEAASADDGGAMYHPKHLVESFARQRMVCALYEPEEGFATDPESEVFKLCERADVVILDWDFHKQPGTKVMDLISGLVASAQTTVPHHVRLCAIYTSTQNLKHITSQIFQHLRDKKLDVTADGEYDLSAGSSRIIVLGKPSTGRPAEQKAAAEVAEVDLADRIIKEFARMHEGILPSMALHGLAGVRNNTKKILDKFRKDMDGAFLTHRALVWPGDDAFEQVPELLAEEALAVMIDNRIPPDLTKKLAEKFVDDMALTTPWPDKDGKATPAGQFHTQLLKEGAGALPKTLKFDTKVIKRLHGQVDTSNTSASERLAALYASRTQYGDKRYLEFGTVVRFTITKDGVDQSKYAVCLMPLCDCVRLADGAAYSFPFWTLRENASKGQSKGMVVELPGKEGFLELYSYGKPRDQLWLASLSAGADGMVEATGDADKGFAFLAGEEKTKLEWIAQLKPSHAQRIAHDLGTSLARVGVIEAEWLRLKADGQPDD